MTSCSRRAFVGTLGSCVAHTALMSMGAPPLMRKLFAAVPKGSVIAREPWGRLEQVGPGLWAMVSTPLAGDRESGAWRTLSNGGIVAGRDGVVVIEAFATPEGARWIAEAAQELTGRLPTDVVVTHYHGDHTRGISGYGDVGEPIRASAPRRRRAGCLAIVRRYRKRRWPRVSLRRSISAIGPYGSFLAPGTRPATSRSRSMNPMSFGAATWYGTDCSPTTSMRLLRSSPKASATY